MTSTISNQEYTLRRDLLNDAIREAEEELKTLKQERKDLDTLFYGKDNPEENSFCGIVLKMKREKFYCTCKLLKT